MELKRHRVSSAPPFSSLAADEVAVKRKRRNKIIIPLTLLEGLLPHPPVVNLLTDLQEDEGKGSVILFPFSIKLLHAFFFYCWYSPYLVVELQLLLLVLSPRGRTFSVCLINKCGATAGN